MLNEKDEKTEIVNKCKKIEERSDIIIRCSALDVRCSTLKLFAAETYHPNPNLEIPLLLCYS